MVLTEPLTQWALPCCALAALLLSCRLCRQYCADVVCSPHHAQLCVVAAVFGAASCGAAVLFDQLLPWWHRQREVPAVNVWVGSELVFQQLHRHDDGQVNVVTGMRGQTCAHWG